MSLNLSDSNALSAVQASPGQPFVIVAGFGAAGATAAVAAAQQGAKVLVVDSAPKAERGGNTSYNSFYMAMSSPDALDEGFAEALRNSMTPWTSYAGEPDETASFWGNNLLAYETWTKQAPGAVKWLQSLGQSFRIRSSDAGFKPGLTPDGGGPALLDLLEKHAQELGVKFQYQTSLVGLETDEQGAVSAAVLESNHRRETVPCSSVIIATGGYQGSQELMTRWVGPKAAYMPPLCRGGYYCRGEGHVAALDVGGAMTGDIGKWTPTAMDARADGDFWSLAGFQMGVMVNQQGVRFTDESKWDAALEAVSQQRGGLAYVVVDARALRHPDADTLLMQGKKREGLNYSMLHKQPLPPVTADTLEDLAGKLGVPVQTFCQDLQAYNVGCMQGATHDEGAVASTGLMEGGGGTTGVAVEKSALAFAVEEGPFYAWPVKAGNVFGFGGLKIDGEGRVLSSQDRPIPGLYAAGDSAAGFFGEYPWYCSTIKAVVFGMVSGKHAAMSES